MCELNFYCITWHACACACLYECVCVCVISASHGAVSIIMHTMPSFLLGHFF